MKVFDVALDQAITTPELGSLDSKEKNLHTSIRELFAKTALLVMASVKNSKKEAYNDIISGRVLVLLQATSYDFERNGVTNFSETDFKILELNDEVLKTFADILEEEEELGIYASLELVYTKMRALRDRSKPGEFGIFFMYLISDPETDTMKMVSDAIVIDNSQGSFDKSVDALIENLGPGLEIVS